jgi:hypothetical protein
MIFLHSNYGEKTMNQLRKDQQEMRYAKWRALIEEQEKSGLSQASFCQKKEIVLSQFSYYRACIKGKTPSKENLFSPIHLEKNYTVGDMQVVLPNGLKCVLPYTADVDYIKRIVGVLLSC